MEKRCKRSDQKRELLEMMNEGMAEERHALVVTTSIDETSRHFKRAKDFDIMMLFSKLSDNELLTARS